MTEGGTGALPSLLACGSKAVYSGHLQTGPKFGLEFERRILRLHPEFGQRSDYNATVAVAALRPA